MPDDNAPPDDGYEYYRILIEAEVPYTQPDGTTAIGHYMFLEDGPSFDGDTEALAFSAALADALRAGKFTVLVDSFNHNMNQWVRKDPDA
jgi:hypothetical protein